MIEPKTKRVAVDKDLHEANRFAEAVLGMLGGFIPDRCRQEARNALVEAALEAGLELTSKAMRKQYEAWKEITLDPFDPSRLIG